MIAYIVADINSKLEKLNNSFFFELTKAMALPQSAEVQALIRLVFGKATLRFAELILGFDRKIEQNGSMVGARWLLQYFVAGHEANGTDLIPKKGPLIIASNHPASYDALAITAHVPRSDLKIIIGEIPPYQYLPHVSQHPPAWSKKSAGSSANTEPSAAPRSKPSAIAR